MNAKNLEDSSLTIQSENGVPIIDQKGKEWLWKKMEEKKIELKKATELGDEQKVRRLDGEITGTRVYLEKVTGLRGKTRKINSAAERARIAIRRNITYQFRKIKQDNSALFKHLDAYLNTGRKCSYTPDPKTAFTWLVSWPKLH